MKIANITKSFNNYVYNRKDKWRKDSTSAWLAKNHAEVFKTDTGLILVYSYSLKEIPKYIKEEVARCFKTNLRSVKIMVNGQPKKVKVCAKCLRSGKVERA